MTFNCEYSIQCQNNDKCYRCSNQNLLKLKGGQRRTAGFLGTTNIRAKQMNSDDSWKDLEQKVADSLNNVPNIEQARRSRASGALWFETGDIQDEILHPECKERMGNELKSGEKSITIKKEWLEKASREVSDGRVMCLPFRFKGDDTIYTIFKHEDIAQLITTMKAYMHHDTEQSALIEEQRKAIREQQMVIEAYEQGMDKLTKIVEKDSE